MEQSRRNFGVPSLSDTGALVTCGKKPRIESQRLFQGTSEIVIVHQKEEYSLRITRNGKLILEVNYQPASQLMRRLMPASEKTTWRNHESTRETCKR